MVEVNSNAPWFVELMQQDVDGRLFMSDDISVIQDAFGRNVFFVNVELVKTLSYDLG